MHLVPHIWKDRELRELILNSNHCHAFKNQIRLLSVKVQFFVFGVVKNHKLNFSGEQTNATYFQLGMLCCFSEKGQQQVPY